MDHIFTLRNILEQSIEWNSNISILLTLKRPSTVSIETLYGSCYYPMAALKSLFQSSNCFTSMFAVVSYVITRPLTGLQSPVVLYRQGCVLSPILFLVAIDWVMRETIGNQKRGIRWTLKSTLEDLDFADDIVLLASSSNHLQGKTNDLSANASKVGLKISRKKLKQCSFQTQRTPYFLRTSILKKLISSHIWAA